MTEIDFQYDLDEIVHIKGFGAVTLRTALSQMPEQVGPLGVLYREEGKTPSLFDAANIQALLDRHRNELEAGKADEHDFE